MPKHAAGKKQERLGTLPSQSVVDAWTPVVAGKRCFVFCCHDLYRSNAELMKQKKRMHGPGGRAQTPLAVQAVLREHLLYRLRFGPPAKPNSNVLSGPYCGMIVIHSSLFRTVFESVSNRFRGVIALQLGN